MGKSLPLCAVCRILLGTSNTPTLSLWPWVTCCVSDTALTHQKEWATSGWPWSVWLLGPPATPCSSATQLTWYSPWTHRTVSIKRRYSHPLADRKSASLSSASVDYRGNGDVSGHGAEPLCLVLQSHCCWFITNQQSLSSAEGMFVLPNGFCDLTLTLCRDFYKIKQNEWETSGSIFVLMPITNESVIHLQIC